MQATTVASVLAKIPESQVQSFSISARHAKLDLAQIKEILNLFGEEDVLVDPKEAASVSDTPQDESEFEDMPKLETI
jgi:hypothetical protein